MPPRIRVSPLFQFRSAADRGRQNPITRTAAFVRSSPRGPAVPKSTPCRTKVAPAPAGTNGTEAVVAEAPDAFVKIGKSWAAVARSRYALQPEPSGVIAEGTPLNQIAP